MIANEPFTNKEQLESGLMTTKNLLPTHEMSNSAFD